MEKHDNHLKKEELPRETPSRKKKRRTRVLGFKQRRTWARRKRGMEGSAQPVRPRIEALTFKTNQREGETRNSTSGKNREGR